MPTFRTRPVRDYSMLRNAMLRDPELSLKAKGLLALMLTFPPDWIYNQDHLLDLSTDGRDATRSAVRELEERGYLFRKQAHTVWGRFGHADLYVTDDLSTVDGFSGDGLPGDGFSGDGEPAPTKTERSTKTDSTKKEVEETRTREGSNGKADPRLLSDLTTFEKRALSMLRTNPDAEDAGRRILGLHRPLWPRLNRLREKHRPDSVTWQQWVSEAWRMIEDDTVRGDRLAEAIDTALATTNVRNPWALVKKIATSDGATTPRRSRATTGSMNTAEADLRERYPEMFE